MDLFDNRQADEEGWDIFDVDSSGYYEIERNDDQQRFDSDGAALLFVVERAREGSDYHRGALERCGIIISGDPEKRPTA